MKVATSKNNQVTKHETSNVKTEKSLFNSSQLPISNDKLTPPPTSGAFAKILDDARHETNKGNDKSLKSNGDASEALDKVGEEEKRTDKSKQTEENGEIEERGGNSQDGEENNENEENHSQLPMNLVAEKKNSHEANAPAARSILHIADLERIVSSVRSESANNQKQILITLKHSVLEGLQVRISLEENGNLKAQFLAKNEEIKKQIKKRERELLDILKQRSPRFSTIDILLA